MIGPIHQIACPVQSPLAMAGPKARAGLRAAPVSGPPIMMAGISVRPTPKPAILGALVETTVAMTADISTKVRIASIAIACAGVSMLYTVGNP